MVSYTYVACARSTKYVTIFFKHKNERLNWTFPRDGKLDIYARLTEFA